MLDARGNNKKDGSFNWSESVVDSCIIAAISFFTTCAALSIVGYRDVIPAAIAGALQFFTTLATKRGLRKENKK